MRAAAPVIQLNFQQAHLQRRSRTRILRRRNTPLAAC
jgi:hypothetical protein